MGRIIDDPILDEDLEKIVDMLEKHYAPAPKITKPKKPTLKGINSRVDRAYTRLIMRSEKLKAKAAAWELAGELCDEFPDKYPDQEKLAKKIQSKIYHK